MGICDICGNEEKLQDAVVEGSLVESCVKCSKFGYVVPIKDVVKKEKPSLEIYENELIPKYNKVIQQTRQIMNLTQGDLARKVNEKESVIKSIESGHLFPSEDLIKKIEIFLRIQLRRETENISFKGNTQDVSSRTIGDLYKEKKDE